MNRLKTVAVSALALVASSAAASADMAVGLVGAKTLVTIDAKSGKAMKTVEVKGVDRLLGIDVRPANNLLYGIAADGSIFTIDPATGEATAAGKLEKTIAGDAAIVDFNPAADKLRFMGMDGTNLRADVDTGKVTTDGSLAFEPDDPNTGKKPAVVAAAYSNSFGKPEKTAMYDIDAALGALIRQTKPNDGTLKAIGALGVGKAKDFAFDIHTTADGKNTAWLIADNKLHTVDVETGKATVLGPVAGAPGAIRDIAVLPSS
ncbi:MAG: DUF4394 domain-containing protein [Hyphomicrobiaceae bacterium]|nr:DUF4394 domain-containing protein [Hyphomicrobiaceae bacterium]